MKKSKISLIAIAIAMAVCMALCVFLPACSSGEKEEGETGGEHEHSYTLKSDDTYHWEECSCGDIINKAEHSSSTWETDRNNHWKVCDTCEAEFAKDAHDFGLDNTCSVCEYEQKVLTATTIYMVGDSTMCGFTDNYYLPRYGYGTQLANYLTDEKDADGNPLVTVKNLALSGRSSQTFLSESNYQTLKSSIGEGDYLIIGFGHNDEKSEEYFSDPEIPYGTDTDGQAEGFEDNLYNNYVKLAEDNNATAILATPIVRFSDKTDYSGSKAHVTDDGDYPAAIRDLGEKTGTTVIDLTAITKDDYEDLKDDAQWYHAFTTVEETTDSSAPMANEIETTDSTEESPQTQLIVPAGRDDTHLNMYGAKMVAYEFVEALAETSNDLAGYIASDNVKPTIASDFDAAINTDYKYQAYTAPDLDNFSSNYWTGFPATESGNTWYATVFGANTQTINATNYTIGYSNSVFTVASNGNSNGKIEANDDGFAAVFMQLGKDDAFTATATVTVTSITTSSNYNQSGFGLMLRDEIYLDKQVGNLASNYVTAGSLGGEGSDGTGAPYANIYRENGSLSKSSSYMLSTPFAVNSVYELKMEKVDRHVNCSITPQGGTAVERTVDDIEFAVMDTDYMYLCMFATRGVAVQYSNVSVNVTVGGAQGA